MEGEWRLGCPVEHHKQGVHSNIKDLNGRFKEVQKYKKMEGPEYPGEGAISNLYSRAQGTTL